MKIKNINDNLGAPVEFEGADIDDCCLAMAVSIVNCGNEISRMLTVDEMNNALVEGIDYEIIEI